MNRRQRREAAKSSSSSSSSTTTTSSQAPSPLPSADAIPLSRPPPPQPRKSKTLYEIASEKQAELSQHGQPFPNTPKLNPPTSPSLLTTTKEIFLRPDGTLSNNPPLTASPATYTSTSTYPVSSSVDELEEKASSPSKPSTSSSSSSSSPLPPLLDTLLTSLTLTLLHFTLSLLSAHQYALSIPFLQLFLTSLLLALPVLTFLVHLAHGHVVRVPYLTPPNPSPSNNAAAPLALQAVFLLTATVSGCRLISVTNEAGYYAVMKKAPPIGVLWVWSVMEMGLGGAVAGVVGPGVYAWWWGYRIW
ncbi:MAG: hypothetical protein Q9160_001962 [Pyrenula sp. 1 TL-2023]